MVYLKPMQSDTELDETFSALAHPARRAMLARLASGDATVSELAAPLNMSLPAVSKHIKVLERAGLITQRTNAQFRPCSINPEALTQIVSWVEHQRAVWESRFDQMDALLKPEK